MCLVHVPIKSLFQIARRRKTSSIFSASEVITELLNLSTSATLEFLRVMFKLT